MLRSVSGVEGLMTSLIYGTGMHIDVERQARVAQLANYTLPMHRAAPRVQCVRIERAFHDVARRALLA